MLGAEGQLFRTKTGELSVRVEVLRLLAKSLRPLPDKWHGLADTELRYRQRYVDLIMTERSREVFRTRTRVLRYLRDFLDALDFLEVETPMMQPIAGRRGRAAVRDAPQCARSDMYLRIAPGALSQAAAWSAASSASTRSTAISATRACRPSTIPSSRCSSCTGPTPIIIELMELIERLLHGLADGLFGSRLLSYQGRDYDLGQPFRRVTIEEAMLERNPALERARLRDVSYLRQACDEHQAAWQPHDGAGKLQIALFEKTVEHTLLDPTFVYAYPLEVSPLSRTNDADPFITDRFEFFLAGRELANGFSELNDPEDQAQRFRAQVQLKTQGDDEAMHYDADYVRALEYGMPPTAGLGLGVDRLVMFLTDSPSIRDVLLFPHLRPET